jgi:hypothetical protein
VILNGKAQDLIFNMSIGLDLYYASWVRSANISCVKSAGDYKSRARSAWSAYNGGSGSICRWLRHNTKMDQQYRSNYDSKPWLRYVKNEKAASRLDVRCLAEGKRPCKVEPE